MNKETGILVSIVAAVLVLAGALILLGGNNSSSTSTQSVWRSDAPIRGNANAKVQLVEFGDFQCPACKAMEPAVADILKNYPNDVVLQYRYFPLTQIHKNALNAAVAAEIAKQNGQFWQMHDSLFANQDSWAEMDNPTDTFAKLAVLAGVDEGTFRSSYTNRQSALDSINLDQQASTNLNLNGTPSFFINGHAYSGQLTEASLVSEIKKYL